MEYTVNGEGFESFTVAVRAANKIRAVVIDARNGRQVWSPAPIRKVKRRHVLVVDGVEREFGSVRGVHG